MNVRVNGEPRELGPGATVDSAVLATGPPVSRQGIAVAVDGEVVPRGQWETTELSEGQEVEILQAVQGG